jgi:phosphohistidine swiveling domain-containing protein
MPQTLWTAFPEETLSAMPFDAAQQLALIDVFDLWDETSPFRRALARLNIAVPDAETDMVMFYKNRPYINATVLTKIVSGGAVKPVADETAGYRFQTSRSPFAYVRLFKLQWRLTQYLQEALQRNAVPEEDDAALAESLALGLCLQALMMRLNAAARGNLAQYLADPKAAPAAQRATVMQLQAVQMRRTQLSPVWHKLFPKQEGAVTEVPPYFWDHPTDITAAALPQNISSEQRLFYGMPVVGGQVSGLAVVMVDDVLPPEKPADKCVFVFRYARPEAVEAYTMADAVLFGDGGALSHACVVAREQGIPCITGLGGAFYDRMKAADNQTWLAIDGAAAMVRVISA